MKSPSICLAVWACCAWFSLAGELLPLANQFVSAVEKLDRKVLDEIYLESPTKTNAVAAFAEAAPMIASGKLKIDAIENELIIGDLGVSLMRLKFAEQPEPRYKPLIFVRANWCLEGVPMGYGGRHEGALRSAERRGTDPSQALRRMGCADGGHAGKESRQGRRPGNEGRGMTFRESRHAAPGPRPPFSSFPAGTIRAMLITLMEPFEALSLFIYICVFLTAPVAWILVLFFKRRWGRRYDGFVETSAEETLEELDREFTAVRRTTIRTQTEYLPFLFECIRENIDSGFEDPQVISLLRRIEFHRPDEERGAMFTIVSGHQRSHLHMRWVRDSCDRISLRIQGAPKIIRALRDHKRKIPKAVTGFS